MQKIEPKKKRVKGAVLVEMALTILPYLFITLGGIEFMWFFHVRQSLGRAADEAVRVVSVDYGDTAGPDYGASSESLEPYRASAIAAAQDFLFEMGFNNDFVNDVVFEIDFINHLDKGPKAYPVGGYPQSDKMRLVGAKLTIPWGNAMIFGNFVATALNLMITTPEEILVISFRFKKWK